MHHVHNLYLFITPPTGYTAVSSRTNFASQKDCYEHEKQFTPKSKKYRPYFKWDLV